MFSNRNQALKVIHESAGSLVITFDEKRFKVSMQTAFIVPSWFGRRKILSWVASPSITLYMTLEALGLYYFAMVLA